MPTMTDPLEARPLRIAGRGEVAEGEVVELDPGRGVRPLRAPSVPAATLLQILFGVCALAGLWIVVAEAVSRTMASGVVALVAGVLGVALSALREAGRI